MDVVVSIAFTNTTSAQDLTITGVMMNQAANTTLTEGNERTLVATTEGSLYNTLHTEAGRNTAFVTFCDVA